MVRNRRHLSRFPSCDFAAMPSMRGASFTPCIFHPFASFSILPSSTLLKYPFAFLLLPLWKGRALSPHSHLYLPTRIHQQFRLFIVRVSGGGGSFHYLPTASAHSAACVCACVCVYVHRWIGVLIRPPDVQSLHIGHLIGQSIETIDRSFCLETDLNSNRGCQYHIM